MALPEAVLWDMDGTIVDTEPYWIEAEHNLVEAYGGRWTKELAHQCVGNELIVSAEIIRANSPVTMPAVEIVDVLLESVVAAMQQHVPWRPGAKELLLALRAEGVPNALVTMSYQSFAQVLVDALPDSTFAAVITGENVTAGKPSPEPYRAACRALDVDPAECIAIEDSPPGITSAVAAGIPTIGVPHIVAIPDLAGSVQIDTLAGVRPADLLAMFDTAQL